MKKRYYLVHTIDSIITLDESATVIKTVNLSEDPRSRAQEIRSLNEGKPIPQLTEALAQVPAEMLVVESKSLSKAVSETEWCGTVDVEFPSQGGRAIRSHLSDPSVRSDKSWGVAQEIASDMVRRSYEDWDRLVVQAVGSIDELDRSMANLYAKCREWYSIHFPELERIVKNEKDYANILIKTDPRSTEDFPDDLEISEHKKHRIESAAKRSVGVKMGEADLEAVRELARSIIFMDERKSEILRYLEALMQDHAPSLTKVAEAGVGARLIARAGSIRKLAMMPSTSVQTLGAEKALFRHITKGAKPPKHGIIFQHPYVRNSPKSIRGKVASTLAAKISLATRMDYITHKDRGDGLKSSLDAIVKRLRKESS